MNSFSKRLNQQSNEYFMLDALQINKIFIEMSQKFLIKLSLTNKILNMKLCQSESIMSETFEFDDDYFQKSQWFSHEKIEEYNESWDFSRKTDFLLSVFLYSEFFDFVKNNFMSVLIFFMNIFSELFVSFCLINSHLFMNNFN